MCLKHLRKTKIHGEHSQKISPVCLTANSWGSIQKNRSCVYSNSCFANLSVFPSLICGSCSSGQGFAYSFLQIPPRNRHACCSAMYFVVAYAYSSLSPFRARPWRANLPSPCIAGGLHNRKHLGGRPDVPPPAQQGDYFVCDTTKTADTGSSGIDC